MKRMLCSLILTLSMVCSLIVPISAQTADDRLANVTAAVKSTLQLDTESYSEFYGELEEHILAPTWHMEWYGDQGTLSISATEEGKILRYSCQDDIVVPISSHSFAPSFPAGSREDARITAQAFLARVLTQGESITMEDSGTDRLNSTSYRFQGEMLVNGLPTDMTYSISVRCEDNQVTSFYRDDLRGQVMGPVPSPIPNTTEGQARTTLRDTLDLRLEYVLPKQGETHAILRYLPEPRDTYYVDAVTGTLVNLTELTQELEKGAMGGASSDTAATEETTAAAPESSLSGAEQAGVSKLEGVLEQEALDAKARAISELGLNAYTLSTVHYSVPREDTKDDTVTATLRYSRQVNGSSWRRTVTVDAKTGALIRVSSSSWMPDEEVSRPFDTAKAQETAVAFLTKYCPEPFAKTALYGHTDALEDDHRLSHSFTFAQQAHGYFYTGNSLAVGVDATDGSISAYEKTFDDSITFEAPIGLLSEQQALDTWLNTYAVTLRYISVPTAVDSSVPNDRALKDYGVSYLYRLVLGYTLERDAYLLGIDAKTGKVSAPDWAAEENRITYQDISNHWAQDKIETLAKYGVGYWDGVFLPNQSLTQLDLLVLLASTEGYVYHAMEEDAADRLYEFSYDLGLLTPEERNDSAILSRGTVVKMMLDAVGYGSIAQLEDIFQTSFTDKDSIPDALYGYAALSQGLGMVSGSADGQFQPNKDATRAQAAVMLYNLMAR